MLDEKPVLSSFVLREAKHWSGIYQKVYKFYLDKHMCVL